jgi:ketosteroid isomerase-like protein
VARLLAVVGRSPARDTGWAVSQEDLDVVRRAYEVFNTRDLDAITELGHPDVEWRPYLSELGGEPLHGVAAVRNYIEGLAAEWEQFQVEPEEFRDVGDAVLVFVRALGRGKESGVETEIHAVHVVTLRDGKIWRLRSYRDPREALEAVGLRE